jgi:hypothetical protein
MKCEDCKWWKPNRESYYRHNGSYLGECHKELPAIRGSARGKWPETYDDDFCSKFEEALKEVDDESHH